MKEVWTYAVNRLEATRSARPTIEAMWSRSRRTERCPFCSELLDEVYRYMAEGWELRRYIEVISSAHRHRRPWLLEDGPNYSQSGYLLGRKGPLAVASHATLIEATEKVCPCCGWWIAFRDYLEDDECVSSHGGIGGLLALDLSDLRTPLQEIRAYLTANYEKRHLINPRLFEETVASVFRDLGFRARVTAYAGDGGIDVILDGPGQETVGVQVKRSRGRIEASQIRELTGALMLRGMTRGAFVTTSSYRAGAKSEAEVSGSIGFPIELYDASRFYDALKIAQRTAYKRDNLEGSPFRIGALPLIGVQRRGLPL